MIRVEQSHDKSVDEIVEEANAIFDEATAMMYEAMSIVNQTIDRSDDIKAPPPHVVADIIAKLHDKYKDFCSAYPIVIRYMVQYGNYSAKAFTKYIKMLAHHPWKNVEDFIQSQCNYVTILYHETMKERGKRFDPKEAQRMRDDVYKSLKQEHALFEDAVSKATTEVEEREKRLNKSKRDDLIKYLKSLS